MVHWKNKLEYFIQLAFPALNNICEQGNSLPNGANSLSKMLVNTSLD